MSDLRAHHRLLTHDKDRVLWLLLGLLPCSFPVTWSSVSRIWIWCEVQGVTLEVSGFLNPQASFYQAWPASKQFVVLHVFFCAFSHLSGMPVTHPEASRLLFFFLSVFSLSFQTRQFCGNCCEFSGSLCYPCSATEPIRRCAVSFSEVSSSKTFSYFSLVLLFLCW